MEKEMKEAFSAIAKGRVEESHLSIGGTQGRPCQVEWSLDAPSKAVRFDDDCIRCVTESCEDLFQEKAEQLTQAMTSGAGKLPSFGTEGGSAKSDGLQDMTVYSRVNESRPR